MVLVTGASGQVGSAVIEALTKKGIETKAFIHNASNIDIVKSKGATEVFVGDMENESDIREAFQNINSIYYICSAVNKKEDEIGAKMIDIAKELGNIYFVYHSVLHSVLQDMPHHKKKLKVEQLLVDSGLEYTIIQPAVFMQMLIPAIESVQNGGPLLQKFYTTNDTKISMIDLDDFAKAVAVVFSSRDFVNGTFELSSTKSYTLSDLEKIFSEIFDKPVRSQFIEDQQFLIQSGMNPDSYQGQTILTMFKHYNEHSFKGNGMILTKILRKEPRSLKQFIEKIISM